MMKQLSDFPITRKWPPKNPGNIQLYAVPTPNGIKVSIMLEECGLPYDAHRISFEDKDQFSEPYVSLNPNSKIPSIIDPHGPGDAPMGLFESGAILIYLAEKTGKFMPSGAARRYHALQWLMFQMGGVGPMLGQLGFFIHGDGKVIEDPRPRERYLTETIRLLRVIDGQLAGRDWMMGAYSIVDIAICPWLRVVRDIYKASDLVGWGDLAHVPAYLDRFLERPAVQTGLRVPAEKG